jgi:hypothetical protein
MRLLLVGALALCITTSARACGPVKPQPRPTSNAKIAAIFAAMRDGTLERNAIPDVTWDDVPALLERAPSKARLTHFPWGLSKLRLEETSEGEVALWLIEGLRHPKGFRWVHPRVSVMWRVGGGHVLAVEAYFKWWNKVGKKARGDAVKADPFEGTNLYWG